MQSCLHFVGWLFSWSWVELSFRCSASANAMHSPCIDLWLIANAEGIHDYDVMCKHLRELKICKGTPWIVSLFISYVSTFSSCDTNHCLLTRVAEDWPNMINTQMLWIKCQNEYSHLNGAETRIGHGILYMIAGSQQWPYSLVEPSRPKWKCDIYGKMKIIGFFWFIGLAIRIAIIVLVGSLWLFDEFNITLSQFWLGRRIRITTIRLDSQPISAQTPSSSRYLARIYVNRVCGVPSAVHRIH